MGSLKSPIERPETRSLSADVVALFPENNYFQNYTSVASKLPHFLE